MANTIPGLSYNQNTPLSSLQQPGMYQPSSLFMQPIGNIYGLSNSSEVGNIPIGGGVSVGLCLSEGTMYLKSMQNNGPVLLGYKISPLENSQPVSNGQKEPNKVEELLKSYDERFNKIESILSEISKGGKDKWAV